MLDRLQTAMTATRRFTADAGHGMRTPLASLGMNLETLTQSRTTRTAARRAAAASNADHQRLVAVLDGLQALARGDAGALPDREPVDLADLAADAVSHACRRHPAVTYRFFDDGSATTVTGWPTGLRLAIDNLLDNAALHGDPTGTVTISVGAEPGQVRLIVDDDGPTCCNSPEIRSRPTSTQPHTATLIGVSRALGSNPPASQRSECSRSSQLAGATYEVVRGQPRRAPAELGRRLVRRWRGCRRMPVMRRRLGRPGC
jgi:phospho-acceptor domain-containing protein